jgi:uncharacterized membrane protein
MDFAILNAVVHADAFPPPDPWFAGGRLNYYYGGFVPVAALAKLTGTPPAVATNLAVALWMALTGSGIFALARTLALAMPGVAERRATLAGAIATIAGVGAGNLGIVSAFVAAPPSGDGPLARLASLVTSPIRAGTGAPRGWSPNGPGPNEIHGSVLHVPARRPARAPARAAARDGRVGSLVDRARTRPPARRVARRDRDRRRDHRYARVTNSWDWPFTTAVAAGAIVVGAHRRWQGGDAGVGRSRRSCCSRLQLAVAWPFASTFATGGVGVHATPVPRRRSS